MWDKKKMFSKSFFAGSHESRLCGEGLNKDWSNQSTENAGVAFVKGAHERNKFFEKIKSIKYDEQVQANKAKD